MLYLHRFFILTAANCVASWNVCGVLIKNKREAVLFFFKIESMNCCNLIAILNILLQMAEVSHGMNLLQ